MRRGLLILLAGCCLLLGACSQPAPDSIRFGIASRAANLDPRYATDATSARINRLLYQRLVDFDAHQRPVPDLADWQQLSPTHYRFTLGTTGRRFHDGSRLTAADVKATYDYILDPANGSPHRGSLSLINSIAAPDSEHIDFYLSRPDPLFPGYLVIGILPRALIEHKADIQAHPVGSGALRFVRRPDAARLTLERLADHQLIDIIQVKDPTVRVLKLQRGELDLIQNDLPAELIGYLKQQPGIRVAQHPGSNFSYIGFNMQTEPTRDHSIREAIGLAIDREAIIHFLLDDAARKAGGLLPPEHWAGNPALQGLPHDPERARQLLAERGYDAQHPLRLEYKTSSDPLRIRIATVIQDQLKRVGIDVAVKTYDWGTFYGDIKTGRFQMYSLSWVGIKTPDIFRYVFYSASVPPAGANRGRYNNPQADRLIETAERSSSLEEQAAEYRKLAALLARDLPYIPLWYEDNIAALRDDIVGYDLAEDGNYDGLQRVIRQ